MSTILFESYYGVETLGSPYLAHHGVKGQKHGRRQYQNLDGSLTPLGREHYCVGPPREKSKDDNVAVRAAKATGRAIVGAGKGIVSVGKGARNLYLRNRKWRVDKAAASGDAKRVAKYSKYMDANQFQNAIDKVDKTIKLNELRGKDVSKYFKFAEKGVNMFSKGVDIYSTGKKALAKLKGRDQDPDVLLEYKKYIVEAAKNAGKDAKAKSGSNADLVTEYFKVVNDAKRAYDKLEKDKNTKKQLKEQQKNEDKMSKSDQALKAMKSKLDVAQTIASNKKAISEMESSIKELDKEIKSQNAKSELDENQKAALRKHIEAFNKYRKEEQKKEEKEEKKKKK